MYLPENITHEIGDHFADHLQVHPTDYVCVYGSSVYSPDKVASDVDLFVVLHEQNDLEAQPLVDFVRDLHVRHGRKIDEEVPYDNKVLYSAIEIEQAVQFGGFDVEGSRIIIPPIRKEATFLQSPAIKARLSLNALTTPHHVIGNDLRQYATARRHAETAVALLAMSQCQPEEFCVSDLFSALTINENGESGEMFLGYKIEYPLVVDRLYEVLDGGCARLAHSGIISLANDKFCIQPRLFDPHSYMQKAVASTTNQH